MKRIKAKKSPQDRLPVVIAKKQLKIDPLMPQLKPSVAKKLSPKGA